MHRRSAWRCAILASALQSTVVTQTENIRDHARPITTRKHGNMHASISGVPYNGSKDRDAPLGALIKRVYLFCLPRGKSFFRQGKDSSRRRHAAVTLRMICRGVPIIMLAQRRTFPWKPCSVRAVALAPFLPLGRAMVQAFDVDYETTITCDLYKTSRNLKIAH